jgi:peptidyl-tRNA hydrolase
MTTSAIPRLRLGIAPRDEPEGASRDLVEYVLEPFAPDQLGVVEAMVARAADACESWLADGLEVSMNRFNGALPAD